jgi:acetyl esterase/lipase
MTSVAACVVAFALGVAACGGGEEDGGAAATAPASTSTETTAPAAPSAEAPPPAQTDPARPDLPADLDISFAGVGARGAWVLRREGDGDDPVVLFLHGWTAVSPELYGPWLTHLVRRGSTVVYPVYQDAPFLAPAVAFDGVVAGVRSALREEELSREGWVVAGHSAGGAMSADYAARAEELGLPSARGVFAAYPGRQIGDNPLRIPEADPEGIPATTRLVALYGTRDAVVGSRTARRTIARARASVEQLVRVDNPAVSEHLGPQRSGPATRRVFWRRLDALIRAVRR